MKILERYVLTTYLTSFALAWLVLSFVLSVGILIKVTGLIAQGVSFGIVGKYMLSGLPEVMSMTIPLALLVSALLVFGRLSADSEISAMRACGVNFLTIMRWPLLVGLALSLFGVYLNNEVAPRGHLIRRNILAGSSIVVGLELLEPGRFIEDIPKMTLWFARKEGNWLYEVLVFDKRSTNVTREIRAEKALIRTNGTDVVLDMYQVRVDPIQEGQPGAAMAAKFTHTLKNILRTKDYRKKTIDFDTQQLFAEVNRIKSETDPRLGKERRKALCQTYFEINRRLVWSAAAFCFVLIGVPLGIKAHRKETTIGMAISMVVGVTFFLCLILAQSIKDKPALYPYVLVWIPVIVCGAIAAVLIPKNQ